MTERLLIWIAWHLPRRLAYWACIRVMTYATVGRYSDQIVSETTIPQVLKRWDD